MPDPSVLIDSYDLSLIGFRLTGLSGWFDEPEHDYPTAAFPHRLELVQLDTSPLRRVRNFTIAGVIKAASRSALMTAIDALKYRASSEAGIVVKLQEDTTRARNAWLTRFTYSPHQPELVNASADIAMEFMTLRAFFQDTGAEIVNLTSTAADLELGTAQTDFLIITINGPATNPVVQYINSDDELVESMSFTDTIAAGDSLVISSLERTITRVTSGVQSNGLSKWTGAAEDFIVPDPRDGDFLTSVWPSMKVTSGTGQAVYNKAWL